VIDVFVKIGALAERKTTRCRKTLASKGGNRRGFAVGRRFVQDDVVDFA
jgi:hypothetical protein